MNIFAAAHSIGSTGIMFGAWFTLGMGMIDQLRRMNRRHEAWGGWQHDAQDEGN
jgi:hypothetical protein